LRILALILARGGSKRLPGKNVRLLGGLPLLAWSIESSRGIPEIVDTLVSTDDEEIADVGRWAGAMVPWLRPPELATDTASSLDACLHGLDWYEEREGAVDGLLLLQPTSPFRSRASVLRGIELFRENELKPVVGVSAAQSHPLWCFRAEGNRMYPFVDGGGLHVRSQDLPPAYAINGAFYLIKPSSLRAARSFFSDDMIPLMMLEAGEEIDIDTERDWNFAQLHVGSKGS
jgi:CMP-N,N'-diacetyllegionaminic acid synthase